MNIHNTLFDIESFSMPAAVAPTCSSPALAEAALLSATSVPTAAHTCRDDPEFAQLEEKLEAERPKEPLVAVDLDADFDRWDAPE